MCRFVVHVHVPGLNRAIVQAAEIIAHAITKLAPPPPSRVQINGGTLTLNPQGSAAMATNIINSKPQHITAVWTGVDATGATVSVTPDTVDFSMSPTGLGTLTPDTTNPTGGATFVANSGALGDITFSATSHQAGLADFAATPVVGTLVSAPPAAIQITGGALSLDPQAP